MGLFTRISGSSGFTLVEVLISVLLFGIVAAMLYAAAVSALNLHARAADRLDLHRAILRTASWLDVDLANLDRRGPEYPVCDSSSVTIKTYEAGMDTSGYRFLRSRTVSYEVDETRLGSSVILRRCLHYGDDTVDTVILRLPVGYSLCFEAARAQAEPLFDSSALAATAAAIAPASLKLIVSQSLASAPGKQVIYERLFIVRKKW